ncbi:MAG: biosynthetic peptidoglycan transglycosylase, partial [Myxococcota bacterium]
MAEAETTTLGQRIGSWFRWIAGASVLIGTIVGIGTVVAIVVGVVLYQNYVVLNPGPHVERDHIRSIIAQESPVYYADGSTRVGVFFDEEHRQYTSFEELPPAYVLSIIAAEDDRYWNHWGIDPVGILRAMRLNLSAGGVVAGGSTLTQQTAKNIYYRPDRSLRAKGIEFLNALRLEHRYSKPEILEFYANQFYVSGNGRGLGIGARHFFNKDVSRLTLAECAFLAGLVKGPANYDPFLGSAARSERNTERAHNRTRYVLGRLVEEDAARLVR